ncbi:hypothetical protein [Amycolatopsis magusensis]|uniref:hypothetical protein n=1 Tax=Amycolatopsis magusensis TaxID=882444 RepID=UPI0037AE12D5
MPIEGPKLGRALEIATMLADSRDDPPAALRLGDEDGARALLSEVDGFGPVGEDEAADEVRRVEELREQLTIE